MRWFMVHLRREPERGWWRVRWTLFGWHSAYYHPHGEHYWEPPTPLG